MSRYIILYSANQFNQPGYCYGFTGYEHSTLYMYTVWRRFGVCVRTAFQIHLATLNAAPDFLGTVFSQSVKIQKIGELSIAHNENRENHFDSLAVQFTNYEEIGP